MRLSIIMVLFSTLLLSSCVLTKVVTVPMRIGGAVISIVPVVRVLMKPLTRQLMLLMLCQSKEIFIGIKKGLL